MKKLILMLALATGLSTITYAKPGNKTPQQKAAHTTKVLTKKLNLSAAQATKVNAIMLTQATRTDSLKNHMSATDKRLNKLSRRSIMLSTEDQMSKVLNADQKKAFDDWKAEKKAKKAGKKNAPKTQG